MIKGAWCWCLHSLQAIQYYCFKNRLTNLPPTEADASTLHNSLETEGEASLHKGTAYESVMAGLPLDVSGMLPTPTLLAGPVSKAKPAPKSQWSTVPKSRPAAGTASFGK